MKDNKITVKELKKQLAMLEEKGYDDYVVWIDPVNTDDCCKMRYGFFNYSDKEKAIMLV